MMANEFAGLQAFVVAVLKADPAVTALTGQRIYDKVPANPKPPYVSLGTDDAVPDDYECIPGVIDALQIDVWDDGVGSKKRLKQVTAAIKAALHEYDGPLDLAGNDALAELQVTGVRHARDPDGVSFHGVVTIEATIEEV